MAATDPPRPPETVPSADKVLKLATPSVNVDGVSGSLMEFAVHMGYVHWLCFGMPLVITSGKDALHTTGSMHYQGLAIDVRTSDKSEAEQMLFLNVLNFAAPERKVTVFDERALPGEPHIHIEYHGK